MIQTLGLSSDDDRPNRSADLVTAFQGVCETQLSAVYAYIRYRVSNADAAEELTAKTFLKAVERLETFDPGRGELTVWLFGIARNVITDHIRARRRWRWLPVDWLHQLESPGPNPERTVVAEEEHRHLAAALAHLPDRDRDVLGLKFASGLTNREIARITKLTESNVGVIVYRAVGRLREQLAGTGGRHG